MKIMRKYTKEYINDRLDKIGFSLLHDNFTIMHNMYDVVDGMGYKYSVYLYDLLFKNKIPYFVHKHNPFVIDNIHQYLVNNHLSTKLLSTEYKNNNAALQWQCSCGKIFEKSWNKFKQGSQTCLTCSVRNSGKFDWDAEWILIEESFKQQGYILLTHRDEYIGDRTKLKYICPKHEEKGTLEVSWNSRKSKGTGCKYCANENNGALKHLPESYLINLVESKGLLYNHVEYQSGKAVLFFLCPEHLDKGLQSTTVGSMRVSKELCGYCTGRCRSHKDFIKDMKELHPDILICSSYTKSGEPVDCKCLIDGYEWKATPNNLYRGQGCKICANKELSISRHKTEEQYLNEVNKKYDGQISLIGSYLDAREKVTCICNIDQTVFEIEASSLVNEAKNPCPVCRSKATRERCVKSHNQFIKELSIINPNILPLESYIDDHTKILCKCLLHNYEWRVAPNKILRRRTGCPKCCVYHNESLACSILDNWGYKYTLQKRFQDCKDINILPFDIFIDDFNIAIEYDGEQHYYPIKRGSMSEEEAQKVFEKTVLHDNIKSMYCKKRNISLIRIPYWEHDNMESYLFDALVKYHAIVV